MSVSYSAAQIAHLVSEFTDPHVREAVELSALPAMLDGTSYFIDVGANVGLYSFHAAKYLRNATLVAIEANPRLLPALTNTIDNLRSDSGPGNEYHIISAAVSDIPGEVYFHISPIPTLSSAICNGSTETVRVPTVQMDDFYRELPAFIKIDVEGAEYRAVKSATRFLKSRHTRFFVELHGWGDKSLRKYPIHLCWLFLTNGYAVKRIGTHYLFQRAEVFARVAAFLRHLPHLVPKYFIFRFLPGLRPALERLRAKWQMCSK